MNRRQRWMLWGTLGLAAIVGVLGTALVLLLPDEQQLAQRIAQGAQDKLGVQVTLGAVHWQMLPPALVIEDASTVQPDPIRFRRLVAQPNLGSLLSGKPSFGHVLVEDGVMPQMSLRDLHVVAAAPGSQDEQPVEQFAFRNLTWVSRFGNRLEFDGKLLFDAGWRPREGVITRPGVQPTTRMDLARNGPDRWQVRVQIGGGTADGEVAITQQPDGGFELAGQLEPRGIAVDSGMQAFKRNSVLRGKATGHTVLSARGKTVGELARSLHTRTEFSVAQATLLRMDVDKAIRTLGQDRAGQTPLRSLSGRMDTQNTPDGMVVRYSAMQARGETFDASGVATIANRQIDAQVTLNPDGAVPPLPMTVAGPIASPKVTITPAAVVKAAVGTVGAAIGKLFGKD